MGKSREALHSARPLLSPEGGQSAAVFAADWPPWRGPDLDRCGCAGRGGPRQLGRGGCQGGCRGERQGDPRPPSDATTTGGLRSLPAQQHAPKARPPPAGRAGGEQATHPPWPAPLGRLAPTWPRARTRPNRPAHSSRWAATSRRIAAARRRPAGSPGRSSSGRSESWRSRPGAWPDRRPGSACWGPAGQADVSR